MYYRYDERFYIIEKSTEELQGDNIVTYWEDFDLNLYDVIVGFIQESTREMLRHTKVLKPVENIESYIKEIKKSQVEAEVEIDYRLCVLELGLA